MPGNTLFEGLKEPTRLEEIEDYKVVIDPIMTSVTCNQLLLRNGQYGLFTMVVLGNGGFVPACVDLHASWKTLKIDRCHIYSSFDLNFLIEHEQRHCMGYQDVLY